MHFAPIVGSMQLLDKVLQLLVKGTNMGLPDWNILYTYDTLCPAGQ